ncbi:MAG: site-2 protease family protein, partial [Clostridia bacterium]|nr:site-2 protease family protein [Clostridia bacterium]
MLTVLIIVVAVILFLLVIMIHEFGHFIFAKGFGVRVNEFAIGMGPKLFSKKRGETKYSLRLLPIGGFCAMEGEDEESDDPKAFNRKKVWQRMLIVVAGAAFNILLGLLFMLIIQVQQPSFESNTVNMVMEPVSTQQFMETSDSDIKYYMRNTAEGETKYYIATDGKEDTLMKGDIIRSVNGYRAFCFNDAYFAMTLDEDGVIDFEVLRDGEKKDITMTFEKEATEYEGISSTVLTVYVAPKAKTFLTVMQETWLQTQYFIRSVYVSLFRMITGQSGFNEMSGPVGIASMIGEVAEAGFAQSFMDGINNILYIMALITVNLGIVNLLPLPALDGGRFVFLLIEAVRGKPINPKYEGIVHMIGLFLLFALMIAITYQDIARL